MNWQIIGWVLLLAAGVAIMMLSTALRIQRLRTRGLTATGTVLGNELHTGRLPSYHAIIEFKTQDGEVMRVVDSSGSGTHYFEQGATVKILYSHLNSNDFLIDHDLLGVKQFIAYSVAIPLAGIILTVCFVGLFST